MKPKGAILIIPSLILTLLIYAAAFVVDETEQVVVTRFGKVARAPVTEPGLQFKLPFIDKTNYFPKNLLEWDGDPGQIPTLDKTYIWVDTFARWKIVDPVIFFQAVNNLISAKGRLDDIIDSAVRNFVTRHHLIETVRNSNRELDTFEMGREDETKDRRSIYTVETGRKKIAEGILAQTKPKLAKFGIEVVDVKIKRINYVEQVRASVYKRMIAERKQIAEKFRSEGRGEAQKIVGEKERELKRITSEAYRTAQEIKGRADAESTALYAAAYGADPGFYSFIKTLEIYKDALGKNSSLVLSTESEFFKYLKGYGEQSGAN